MARNNSKARPVSRVKAKSVRHSKAGPKEKRVVTLRFRKGIESKPNINGYSLDIVSGGKREPGNTPNRENGISVEPRETDEIGSWDEDAFYNGLVDKVNSDLKKLQQTPTKFSLLLEQMARIHASKSADYSKATDPYSNFKYAAQVADVPIYKVYLVLLGIKFARILQLLETDQIPNNESINDTFLDSATYAAIMSSHLMEDSVGAKV